MYLSNKNLEDTSAKDVVHSTVAVPHQAAADKSLVYYYYAYATIP
jgi:hypothetical protein